MALIMVVDDEQIARDGIARILSREGYEVKLAASGDEALSLLEKIKPDAILLDFKMPGLDGVEVCKRIRANENTETIPIIMVTGFPEEKEIAVLAGADDFLDKPMDPVDLSMRLRCVLKIGKIVDELERTKAYLEELRKVEKEKERKEKI
ncbi:MAG: response regulator [Candidatus Omnitrophota bacterium]|nr:response regulator [Candidatus Omnitrophota bacterium]